MASAERRILLSNAARSDITNIGDYLATEFGSNAALRTIERIDDVISGLAQFPERGAFTTRSTIRPRCIVVARYVIYYDVTVSDIRIVRVLHGARDHEVELD